MKKFSFELQSILEYRQFLEEEAQSDLAKALSVETSIQNQLKDIASRYIEVKAQLSGSKDFTEILNANQYYFFLDTKKEELLQELAEAKIVSEQKRDVLREAMKQTQSLEKLRDSEYDAWREAAALEEEILADEVNSGKRFRQ